MKNWKFHLIILCLVLIPYTALLAQEKVITAGFQFKPIFSSQFFSAGPETSSASGIDFKISPKSGYCLGMVIRKGITNTVSFETGINYVKRNFELNIKDTTFSGTSEFSVVGYEIPVLGLIFIQLSDRIFMDVALGFSLDFYPSDIRTYDTYYEHYSARDSWFSPAVLGNLGWEYRTEKSGYFYLGASYHRPFNITYYSFVGSPDLQPGSPQTRLELQGNYLTLDFRYFFHSDPQKRKKKIRKADSKTK
ncbi:MAG: hypothetical protein IPP71_12645 [Bacteroidetes bacterium]|nr:hypothetical protein [Bacteroidota bacterium]